MKYDTIIANGTVVNADKSVRADVAVKGEKIALVGKGLAAKAKGNGTRVIDARGCYVIPGGSTSTSTWRFRSAGRCRRTTTTRGRGRRLGAG